MSLGSGSQNAQAKISNNRMPLAEVWKEIKSSQGEHKRVSKMTEKGLWSKNWAAKKCKGQQVKAGDEKKKQNYIELLMVEYDNQGIIQQLFSAFNNWIVEFIQL